MGTSPWLVFSVTVTVPVVAMPSVFGVETSLAASPPPAGYSQVTVSGSASARAMASGVSSGEVVSVSLAVTSSSSSPMVVRNQMPPTRTTRMARVVTTTPNGLAFSARSRRPSSRSRFFIASRRRCSLPCTVASFDRVPVSRDIWRDVQQNIMPCEGLRVGNGAVRARDIRVGSGTDSGRIRGK